MADETYTVSVWLKADIQPLPKPEKLSFGELAGGEGSGGGTAEIPPAALALDGTKTPVKPLPLDQVPPEVLKELGGALPEAQKLEQAEPDKTAPDAPTALETAKQAEEQQSAGASQGV